MTGTPLFGRRIHIAGSISDDASVATSDEVRAARELVKGLVLNLLQRGATFVVPVDAERLRECDHLPTCFDWLIWRTLYDNLTRRPSGASNPLAIAVQHHKNEEQIPQEFEQLWEDLRASDLVHIENGLYPGFSTDVKLCTRGGFEGFIAYGIGGESAQECRGHPHTRRSCPRRPRDCGIHWPDS